MFNFYLDDYNLIYCEKRVLSEDLTLFVDDNRINFTCINNDNDTLIYLNDDFNENKKYQVFYRDEECLLIPRFIFNTKRFENEYDVDFNTLGCFILNNNTFFRLWAPLSKKAYVCIDNKRYLMNYVGRGIYELRLFFNKEACLYHYLLIREKEYEFSDPFSYLDFNNNDSYILDFNKFDNTKILPSFCHTKIIYELSIRDFSSDSNVSFKYPKKILALSEEDLKLDDKEVGFDYLKNLGISHIQIMPIFSFDLDNSIYNWGYNPLSYNSLESSYLVNSDPYKRIEELKKVVDLCHKNNIRVNLDVVYNHVYNVDKFSLNKVLPYYFFRYVDNRLANGTGCGNEFRSESYFGRKYLKFIIKRLINIYDIDGLRFDLMGILDIDTINEIKEECLKIKSDFFIYGEGWNMGEVLPFEKRACMDNAKNMEGVAFFNDIFREIIKGNDLNNQNVYMLGNVSLKEEVKKLLAGSYEYGLNKEQSINYLECHDNSTIYDKISKYFKDEKTIRNISKLTLALVVLSRGIPFIHSGQEFLRTKYGEDNTYNMGDKYNKLDWLLKNKNIDISNYLKDLISFRKQYNVFDKEEVDISFVDYYEVLIYKINNLRIYINSCVFDHIYDDGLEYEVIFDDSGFVNYKTKTLKIKAFSILVTINSSSY